MASSELVPKPPTVDTDQAQSDMPSGQASTTPDTPLQSSSTGPTSDQPVRSTAPLPAPQAPPTQAATTTCRYWAEGYCFRGALCWYKHSHDTAPTSSAEPAPTNAAGEAAAAPQGDSSRPKSPKSPTTRALNAQASAFSPATATLAADQVAEEIAQVDPEAPPSDSERGHTEEVRGQATPSVSTSDQQAGPSRIPEQPACMICYEMPATYGLLGEWPRNDQ
jgi:hypothetical protein